MAPPADWERLARQAEEVVRNLQAAQREVATAERLALALARERRAAMAASKVGQTALEAQKAEQANRSLERLTEELDKATAHVSDSRAVVGAEVQAQPLPGFNYERLGYTEAEWLRFPQSERARLQQIAESVWTGPLTDIAASSTEPERLGWYLVSQRAGEYGAQAEREVFAASPMQAIERYKAMAPGAREVFATTLPVRYAK